MGGEQDDFALELGITAFKNADDIAGRPVFGTFTEPELAGNILNITAFVARRGNADPLKFGGDIGGGDQLIGGAAASSVQCIARQEAQLRVDPRCQAVMRLQVLNITCGTAER